MGFWHPFGPHGRETTQEILKRKQKEIDNSGWTLWSFQSRTAGTLGAWRLSERRFRERDLSDLAGSWRNDPAFEAALAEQDTIDAELWR